MMTGSPTTSRSNFIDVARREGLLDDDSAAELTRASLDRDFSPSQLSVQNGLLTSAQVEIVETLLNPNGVINGYELQGLLGYGGMGVVYRARQLSLDRIVALKTVMLTSKSSLNRSSRFEQEAQTVGRLQHPHIITAYDFGRVGCRYFFAMELVEGEDVERRISRIGPLSESMTWSLIRQAATGLAHAAEFGVVHRDIKPANLLLVTPPTGFPLPHGIPMVKIADFGLALINDEAEVRTRLTADGSMLGSPHYMAPEQLIPGGIIDRRTDLYALGGSAYHMLAGHPPFHGLPLSQIFAQKLNHEPPSLTDFRSGLSLESLTLVQDLMVRDQTQRLDNYAELLARIDSLTGLDQNPTSLRNSSQQTIATETRRMSVPHPLPRKTSTMRSSRKWWGTAVRCLMAVGVAIGLGWTIQSRRPIPVRPVNRPLTELKPTGVAADLFDGESLAHWFVRSGNWQTANDAEGATVLAASHGEVERSISQDASGRAIPMTFFRLRFNVQLGLADAVEVSFGISSPKSDAEVRSILRVEPKRLSLSRQTGTQQPQYLKLEDSSRIDPDRYHEIRIERQSRDWRAYVDDRLIGTVPLSPQEIPMFRLATDSGSRTQLAFFADFIVEELSPPEKVN